MQIKWVSNGLHLGPEHVEGEFLSARYLLTGKFSIKVRKGILFERSFVDVGPSTFRFCSFIKEHLFKVLIYNLYNM